MTTSDLPPMDPRSDEASEHQLALARDQGRAYGSALEHMTADIAIDGGEQRAGDYLIGFAVEKAEGLYMWEDDELVWHEPEEENLHVEVAVRDAADGRFVPGVEVRATLLDSRGDDLGTSVLPLLWHPMMYHYGSNWNVPGDGRYTLRVHVEPPGFARHDDINGRRFCDSADVEFRDVAVQAGHG